MENLLTIRDLTIHYASGKRTVKAVNGIAADYDADGCYWALYIDGSYAATGVDTTPVTDGGSYSFVREAA